jgi:hypothetical protein
MVRVADVDGATGGWSIVLDVSGGRSAEKVDFCASYSMGLRSSRSTNSRRMTSP